MITAPNTIIKIAVTGIVKFGDKSSNFTSPTYWEQLSNDWIDFTVNESRKITADAPTDFFELGEFIEVKTSNGFVFPNQVELITTGASPVIILKNDILDYTEEEITSGTISIRTKIPKTSIKSMDEGYYVIQPSNTKLVIRSNWQQPTLKMEELSSYYKDLGNLSLAEITNIESTALTSIYKDLSGYGNYFDIIDEIDLEKLLLYKVLCIIYKSSGSEITDNNDYCKVYESKIQTYKPESKYDIDDTTGEITNDTPNMEISVGGYSL